MTERGRIEKAAKALAQLSDAEWAQVKTDEERRRADQHIIRTSPNGIANFER